MIRRHPFFSGIVLLILLVVAYAVFGYLLGKTPFSRIGVITIKEEIIDAGSVLDAIQRAAQDSSIKALVIKIDSPGGSVAESQEIYNALLKIRTSRPVVASLGSIATSGGYYIACGANKIVANPGTLTGSISAVMVFHNMKNLMEKIGIDSNTIKSGKYKDIGSPLRKMTKEEALILQSLVDDVSDQFITVVAENRNMTKASVSMIADGSIFTGRQAQARGLVDELGGLSESIQLAALLAKISPETSVVYLNAEENTFMDYVIGLFSNTMESKTRAFARPKLYYL
ncbi:MAG: signal peptide peptidase SppA [Deltaproteobacteria bacterium]|nr:signal peptide peptidase SppA [Deltaproteobacteria bacterium]